MNIIGLEVVESPGISIAPPGKLESTYGQTLRITTRFSYRGPAVDITLYGSIGNRGWAGFDEIISAETTHQTPNSPTAFVPVTASVDIPITVDISPGTDYDLYVKLLEYPEAGAPEVDDIIDIVGIPPVPPPEEEKKFPWTWVIVGTGAGIAIIGIAAAAKKR